jgi:Protein of unknown function (DUF2442)
MITARLLDGRIISVPLAWSWRLAAATPAQRANYRIIGDGQGVHWPDVDEDISAAGMLTGEPARPPRRKRLGASAKAFRRQRLEIAIHHEIAAPLKRAAARRDLSVRQYVTHAIQDCIRADLIGADTAVMASSTDPALAELWNNRRDAVYDRL